MLQIKRKSSSCEAQGSEKMEKLKRNTKSKSDMRNEKRRRSTGREKHSPHSIRETSHFITRYRDPSTTKKRGDQWGLRVLQASPETGS
jgi:hypothetical protein